MELSKVIIGSVATEKAERLKTDKTYTLHVAPRSNKVEIKAALKKYWDVDVDKVRIVNVGPKIRLMGRSTAMEKRHPYKKAIVKLTTDSKLLDLGSLKS